MAAMRNYIYISDSKVDAYIGHMDEKAKKTVVKQIGLKLAIFDAKISSEASRESDRVSRLLAVERGILDNEEVGAVDEGKPWIEDRADLVTTTFRGDERNLAFFFAPDGEQFLGLGGSAVHVVGGIGPIEPVDAPYKPSHLNDMLSMLESVTDAFPTYMFKVKEQAALRHDLEAGHVKDPEAKWAPVLSAIATQFGDRPRQRASFLARRLITENYGYEGWSYTLATPLYVALDDVTAPKTG